MAYFKEDTMAKLENKGRNWGLPLQKIRAGRRRGNPPARAGLPSQRLDSGFRRNDERDLGADKETTCHGKDIF
jgi:hypothetical protein